MEQPSSIPQNSFKAKKHSKRKGRCESEPIVLPIHDYRYFAVQFHPMDRGKVAILFDLHSIAGYDSHLKLYEKFDSIDSMMEKYAINTQQGHAVYGHLTPLMKYLPDWNV
jgi:hypothetical protein